jgi:hypothetical protein
MHPVHDHLACAVDDNLVAGTGLFTALARVADPRKRRGVPHQTGAILAVAGCAALGPVAGVRDRQGGCPREPAGPLLHWRWVLARRASRPSTARCSGQMLTSWTPRSGTGLRIAFTPPAGKRRAWPSTARPIQNIPRGHHELGDARNSESPSPDCLRRADHGDLTHPD